MSAMIGGNKFSKILTEMAGSLGTDRNTVLRVGFLEGATYPAGAVKHLTQKQLTKVLGGGAVRTAKGEAGAKPVAMIAAIQEFGSPSRGIPPRPYFRHMIADKSKTWAAGIAVQLKETGYNADLTLRRTGEVISGQLRESIIATNSPPLSPRTIAKKGFSKPLIDSSHMINSIDYEIRT